MLAQHAVVAVLTPPEEPATLTGVAAARRAKESVEKMEQQESIQDVQKNSNKRRYMMLGLATLGKRVLVISGWWVNANANSGL